jgi:hypothetical protein
MLSDQEIRELDQLWQELHFVSHDALALVDALEQLLEYATQDADPSVFQPLRQPIQERAAEFRRLLADSEPRQFEALTRFASEAYRRPIRAAEAAELRELYNRLRAEGMAHHEAFRFTLARIFISPSFLYRLEAAPPGAAAAPVSDWELASRLSYFLWSSMPDAELRAAAASNTLHQPEVLKRQARRMLQSPHVRRLAVEFACQWLQIRDFDSLDEKSPEAFPEFAELREDMYEESIRFFTDFFQRDASVLSLFQADHTFVNPTLAGFYGIPLDSGVAEDTWHRVDGIERYGRGGILGLAATLARHSGASRTSPILRGNWVSEVLLGEQLPDPPQGVPPFPEQGEATRGLTVRQLTELHSSDPNCARCHQRFDHFGFALEHYDAIGRWQEHDREGLAIEATVALPDGGRLDAMPGLRNYLAVTRRHAVVRQFCRKLLGYALGRGLMLSDDPLLDEMQSRLAANDYRFTAALDVILESRQFRYIRGREYTGRPTLDSKVESHR